MDADIPDHFAPVPVSGSDRFFVKIAFGRAIDPLRPRALIHLNGTLLALFAPKHLAGERYFLPLCDT